VHLVPVVLTDGSPFIHQGERVVPWDRSFWFCPLDELVFPRKASSTFPLKVLPGGQK
jgi:hypothetical protein